MEKDDRLMKTLRLFLCCALIALNVTAQDLLIKPFSSAANFSADLLGPIDTRGACCWGNADFTEWSITFRPPAGYRVRILALHGDLVAWPRVLPGQPAVPPGSYAGVLLAFRSSAQPHSDNCDLCDDPTMLYLQGATHSEPTRVPFDQTDLSALLEPDNKLIVRVASWPNTTGYPIHIEPTFTVRYRYERATTVEIQN
jgi:hypothetical protein